MTPDLRYGAVVACADGMAMRTTNYRDIDETRAAAERLAARGRRCHTRT
jgi:hypothetical protein